MRYAFRFGAAWVLCVHLAHLAANSLVAQLAPAISFVSEAIHSATAITLVVRPEDNEVEVRTFLLKPVRLSDSLFLRGHSRLPVTSVSSNHLVVPSAIILTILLALPAPSLKAKTKVVLVGGATALLVTVLNAGVLIAGKIDIVFLEAYLKVGIDRDQSGLIWLVILMETGVTWVLTIGVSLLLHRLLIMRACSSAQTPELKMMQAANAI
ncbi:hypothetical protein [Pelomonas cellulosilytica]|uniref:Uncharacterized protein n=1 Tax=Pelomonas cellulosilytica TaxID=2906762 RepID=A0ABS8XXI2_9BURK|nr:hypothetical protein [Pelomonas sp. P8]MCE4557366.1 hypothetical protein [Pelomonas sp. P8]